MNPYPTTKRERDAARYQQARRIAEAIALFIMFTVIIGSLAALGFVAGYIRGLLQ